MEANLKGDETAVGYETTLSANDFPFGASQKITQRTIPDASP